MIAAKQFTENFMEWSNHSCIPVAGLCIHVYQDIVGSLTSPITNSTLTRITEKSSHLIIGRLSFIAESEVVLERFQGRRSSPFGQRSLLHKSPAAEMPEEQNADGDQAKDAHQRAE